MALRSLTASPESLLSQAGVLPPTERTILRLKALMGPATNKADFLAALVAAGSRAPDGKAWSHKLLNDVLNRLMSQGLLKEDLSCPEVLWHPLAADAAAASEGAALIEAVRQQFPEAAPRPYYTTSPQTEWTLQRLLRLAYDRHCDKLKFSYSQFNRYVRRYILGMAKAKAPENAPEANPTRPVTERAERQNQSLPVGQPGFNYSPRTNKDDLI